MKLHKSSKLQIIAILLVSIMTSQTAIAANNEQAITKASTERNKEIYRNVNEDGVVEFSDQNLINSKKIRLKSVNTFKAAEKKAPSKNFTNESESEAPLLKGLVNYTELAISSPTQDQQIRSNNGLVTISISIKPALNVVDGDQIELFFDGRSQGKQQNTIFNLKEVYRGQHRVQAKVINKIGKVLKTSKPIQFVIHKFSALFNKKPVKSKKLAKNPATNP